MRWENFKAIKTGLKWRRRIVRSYWKWRGKRLIGKKGKWQRWYFSSKTSCGQRIMKKWRKIMPCYLWKMNNYKKTIRALWRKWLSIDNIWNYRYSKWPSKLKIYRSRWQMTGKNSTGIFKTMTSWPWSNCKTITTLWRNRSRRQDWEMNNCRC